MNDNGEATNGEAWYIYESHSDDDAQVFARCLKIILINGLKNNLKKAHLKMMHQMK